jgi:thioredoxin reductase (NADPH)
VLLNYLPKKIKNHALTIIANKNSKEKVIPFDKLIVQYGQSLKQDINRLFPNIKLVNNTRIDVAINQQTNIKNVFAIGDVCIYHDKPSSLICAHGEAAVAVRSIINDMRQYDKK